MLEMDVEVGRGMKVLFVSILDGYFLYRHFQILDLLQKRIRIERESGKIQVEGYVICNDFPFFIRSYTLPLLSSSITCAKYFSLFQF